MASGTWEVDMEWNRRPGQRGQQHEIRKERKKTNLRADGIFNSHNADTRQVADNIVLIIPVGLVLKTDLVYFGFARRRNEIAVRDGNGT